MDDRMMAQEGIARHISPHPGAGGMRVDGLGDAYRTAESGDLEGACDMLERILTERDLPLEVELQLLRELTGWYGAMSQPALALRTADRASRCAVAEYGPTDELSLVMRSSFLYWQCQAGLPQASVARFADLIGDVEATLGADDPLAWAVRNNSAMPHKMLGEFRTAAAIYRDLLADMADTLDPSDPVVLTTRDNLAEVLGADGQLEASTDEYRSVLGSLLDVTGPDDRRVLRLRHEIAANTFAMGDEESAREMWAVLAEDCRRYLGECDTETARQRMLQILMCMERRDSRGLVEWCERLLANLPPGHPEEEVAVIREVMEEHRVILREMG